MVKRFYQMLAAERLRKYRQMLFVAGPRQVGKTTMGQALGADERQFEFFSWDNERHRELIAKGPDAIAAMARLDEQRADVPLLMFDEIHRFGHWKRFLKGLYDTYPQQAHIFVTGSARLDVYQHGADSLLGRYFLARMHPLSVGELLYPDEVPQGLREEPRRLSEDQFDALWRFGGFPQPFLTAEEGFYNLWKQQRFDLLFREDLRETSRIQRLSQVEMLAELIRRHTGQLTRYTSLGQKVRVTGNTVREWLTVLGHLYYSFEVRPWSKNVSRSLLKEPKYYLWDWALISDEAARAENMIACHLLKAVHLWTDLGLGHFGLYYVRDKQQREVDFVVTRDDEPWFLVEVKLSNSNSVSSALRYFHEVLQPEYAFQCVIQMPYQDHSCLVGKHPVVVPARTLLSQLV